MRRVSHSIDVFDARPSDIPADVSTILPLRERDNARLSTELARRVVPIPDQLSPDTETAAP
jgi:hypothetical protein